VRAEHLNCNQNGAQRTARPTTLPALPYCLCSHAAMFPCSNAWVAEGTWFFVTINCVPRGKNQLCRLDIDDAVLAAMKFNHSASLDYSSRVKPTLRVTCQSRTCPSSIHPRVSVTSNHRMLRTVFLARANAFCTAFSNPFGDEPTISIFL